MTQSRKSQPDRKSLWTPARLAATFAVLALISAFLLPSCNQTPEVAKSNTTNSAPTSAGNQTAPVRATPLASTVLNMELKDLDRKPFKLADYAGKVVVVNLWATWCGPCRVEIPELIKLGNEYKSRGVELIGVTNEDPVEDESKVKDFVARQSINYRIAWAADGFAVGLMQGDVRNVIPQSFVITREGAVVGHFTGFDPRTTPQKLRTAVEQALNYKG